MKNAPPAILCPHCELSSPGPVCANCKADRTFRFDHTPKRDRYSQEEREAFRRLDEVTAMEGSA